MNDEQPNTELLYVDYVKYGLEDGFSENKRDQLFNCNVEFRPFVIEDLTFEFLEGLYQLWSKDYQIDGLVIDVNNSEKRKELGRLPNGNPRYALAYRDWETDRKSTRLNSSHSAKSRMPSSA